MQKSYAQVSDSRPGLAFSPRSTRTAPLPSEVSHLTPPPLFLSSSLSQYFNDCQVERLATRHSLPSWLAARLLEEYGPQSADALCEVRGYTPRPLCFITLLSLSSLRKTEEIPD